MDPPLFLLMLLLVAPWVVAWAFEHPRQARVGGAIVLALFFAVSVIHNVLNGWPAPERQPAWLVIEVALVSAVLEFMRRRATPWQVFRTAISWGSVWIVVEAVIFYVYYHALYSAPFTDGLLATATIIIVGFIIVGVRRWRGVYGR